MASLTWSSRRVHRGVQRNSLLLEGVLDPCRPVVKVFASSALVAEDGAPVVPEDFCHGVLVLGGVAVEDRGHGLDRLGGVWEEALDLPEEVVLPLGVLVLGKRRSETCQVVDAVHEVVPG